MSQPPEEEMLPFANVGAPGERCLKAIRAECTEDLKPCPSHSVRGRLLLSGLLCGGLLLLTSVFSQHAPADLLSVGVLGALAWVIVQLLVLIMGLGTAPGKPGGTRRRMIMAVTVPTLFLVYLACMGTGHGSPSTLFSEAAACVYTAKCALFCFGLGAVASGGLFFLWKRSDPFGPGASGALLGLVGGLVGGVAGLGCAGMPAWHLWLGHGLSLCLLVVACGLLGRRVLRP